MRERKLGLISDVGRSVLFAVPVYSGSGFPLFSVQGWTCWFSWQWSGIYLYSKQL